MASFIEDLYFLPKATGTGDIADVDEPGEGDSFSGNDSSVWEDLKDTNPPLEQRENRVDYTETDQQSATQPEDPINLDQADDPERQEQAGDEAEGDDEADGPPDPADTDAGRFTDSTDEVRYPEQGFESSDTSYEEPERVLGGVFAFNRTDYRPGSKPDPRAAERTEGLLDDLLEAVEQASQVTAEPDVITAPDSHPGEVLDIVEAGPAAKSWTDMFVDELYIRMERDFNNWRENALAVMSVYDMGDLLRGRMLDGERQFMRETQWLFGWDLGDQEPLSDFADESELAEVTSEAGMEEDIDSYDEEQLDLLNDMTTQSNLVGFSDIIGGIDIDTLLTEFNITAADDV